MEIKEGLHWDEIRDVGLSLHLEPHQVEAIKRYQNRFNIPSGLEKKELTKLLKETQNKINECLAQMRTLGPGNNILADIEREDYVIKKAKIKKILALHNNFGTESLAKAKSYPIENLLEFNSGGFVSCPFHGPEKTPSAKWYPQRNKIHCFGCHVDADSIDVYQKINNVDFLTAVKALS